MPCIAINSVIRDVWPWCCLNDTLTRCVLSSMILVMHTTEGNPMAFSKSLLLAAFATGLVIAGSAWAGGPRWDRSAHYGNGYEGYVVAESRFGHGTVSGPVRRGRTGYEVRMPGGTWIACRRSCSETLRVETVDFWENRGAGRNAIDTECGILGCLRWEWEY